MSQLCPFCHGVHKGSCPRSMSESRVACPQCSRPPGGIHSDFCPRSTVSRQALDDWAAKAGQPRILWTKGPIAYRSPGSRRVKFTFNPGVPFVKPPKPWYAGGVPRDTDAVETFIKTLRGEL